MERPPYPKRNSSFLDWLFALQTWILLVISFLNFQAGLGSGPQKEEKEKTTKLHFVGCCYCNKKGKKQTSDFLNIDFNKILHPTYMDK